MTQFAFRSGQAAANLPQGLGMPQLAEQHRDELPPTAEPAGMTLGLIRADHRLEVNARNQLQNLRENATNSIHG
jgi:hypothetical protein